jgi:hypothetical protein
LVGKTLPFWFNRQQTFYKGLIVMIEQRLAEVGSSERYVS